MPAYTPDKTDLQLSSPTFQKKFFSIFWLLKNWIYLAVLLWIIIAITAPFMIKMLGIDPYTYHQNLLNSHSVPSGFLGGVGSDHWLGIEPLTGRDILAIIIMGTQTSLLISGASLIIALLLGTAIGVSAGYFGGWYDRIINILINVLFSFPTLILMIAISAVIPTHFPHAYIEIAIMSLCGWPSSARVLRARTLSLRSANYIRSAYVMGASHLRILLGEIFPHIHRLCLVLGTLMLPRLIGTEAALSFLGVGIPPPTPSWGRTISDAINWIYVDPWYLIFPGIALITALLSFSALADRFGEKLTDRSIEKLLERTDNPPRIESAA